jgi:membrane-associated protease RseP (regulator of RpoE activity)
MRSIATRRAARLLSVLVITLLAQGCMAPRTAGVVVDPAAAAREEQTQRRMKIEREFKQQMRVSTVAYPILKGSTSLCGEDVAPALGMVVATSRDFGKEDAAAAAAYGLGERVTVIGVVPGSGAALAGLQRGDVLVQINGQAVPTGKKATANTLELLRDQEALSPQLNFLIERSGHPQQIAATAVPACSYPVIVMRDDTVNAFADGDNIFVTTGMLRFVENDQELATVIGHELAHNAMHHSSSKTVNMAIGTVFDVLAAVYGVNTNGAFGNIGAQSYSKEFEAEADYVGVYALALSGADLNGVADFWRRMGSELGGIKTPYGASHPGSTERYLAIESTTAEVNEKSVQMLPLTPNMKK